MRKEKYVSSERNKMNVNVNIFLIRKHARFACSAPKYFNNFPDALASRRHNGQMRSYDDYNILLKVHDVYTTSSPSYLLFSTTDRISAFDVILKFGIPERGELLMKISLYWFEKFGSVIPDHLITADVD